MIDINNMSLNELTALENQIKRLKEKKREESFSKYSLTNRKILDLLFHRFRAAKYLDPKDKEIPYSESIPDVFPYVVVTLNRRVENSLFALCDIALGNYKDAKANKKLYYTVNYNGLILCDYEKYTQMYNELFEVFYRYADSYNILNGYSIGEL